MKKILVWSLLYWFKKISIYYEGWDDIFIVKLVIYIYIYFVKIIKFDLFIIVILLIKNCILRLNVYYFCK